MGNIRLYKIITIIVLLIIAIVAFVSSNNNQSDGLNQDVEIFYENGIPLFKYNLNKDTKGVEIVDCIISDKNKSIKIPDEIKGYPVKAIKVYAFANIDLLQLELPDSISYIDMYAFQFSNINKLNLPKNLTIIDNYAFNKAHLKDTLIIPDSVKIIGDYAFSENEISEVVLGKNIKEIGFASFSFNKIKSLKFKDNAKNLEVIGDKAFSGAKVDIKYSVNDFEKLKVWDFNESILTDKTARMNYR
ncbi:TPA: leucine-rich repeat domain-containing protein [Enterococcus faecium]